jgi:hypothetical protein
MVAIYIRWIKAGRMTIDEVPLKWREEVEKTLIEQSGGKL